MSIIRTMRRQKAVWWQRQTEPDKFGRLSFAEPVEIACRWDDNIGEFRNQFGQTVASKAVVYVDREMKVGDKLMSGPISSDTPEDPTTEDNALEIQGFMKTPNIKNTETLYTALL